MLAGMTMRPAAISSRIWGAVRWGSRRATRVISGVMMPSRADSSWVMGVKGTGVVTCVVTPRALVKVCVVLPGLGFRVSGFGWRQEVAVHHHHAADPERDDLAGGGEDGGGVEGREQAGGLRGLRGVGPAERGEGPEGAGEPGVEDVGVLDEAIRFPVKLSRKIFFLKANEDVVLWRLSCRGWMMNF